jgi:GSH-dependent disulfide-bond oxidoreductase
MKAVLTLASLVTPKIFLTARSSLIGASTLTTTINLSSMSKPTLPEDYQIPKVWEYNAETMKPVHGSNIPTSGALTNKELPRGQHDIQLYSLATPNGIKANIMLEELVERDANFDYDAYFIHIGKGDQFTSGFVQVNPNSKIPALYDQSNQARVFESGAILLYLAEKYGALLPTDPVKRAECMSWVFFQVGAGPFYGGGGLTHLKNSAPLAWEYAIDRYTIETKRILHVLDTALDKKSYLCGDEYTIADIMHYKWTKNLIEQEYLDGASYKNLQRWVAEIDKRPAVIRGARLLGFGDDGVKERHSRKDLE